MTFFFSLVIYFKLSKKSKDKEKLKKKYTNSFTNPDILGNESGSISPIAEHSSEHENQEKTELAKSANSLHNMSSFEQAKEIFNAKAEGTMYTKKPLTKSKSSNVTISRNKVILD